MKPKCLNVETKTAQGFSKQFGGKGKGTSNASINLTLIFLTPKVSYLKNMHILNRTMSDYQKQGKCALVLLT